jgi:XTP/dITP diphosphohydrolase
VPDGFEHRAELSSLLLATRNPGKQSELTRLLEPLGIEVATPADLDLDLAVAETGATFAENARLKAEGLATTAGRATLADDSGLEVDVLGGRPGVHSARFGGPGLDDAGRVRLLLERLRDVPPDRRTARFVCVLALAMPRGATTLFEGVVEGLIAAEPCGEGGFGYDPVFLYPPAGRTFAELGGDEKAAVSHRGRAIRKLVEYLQEAR